MSEGASEKWEKRGMDSGGRSCPDPAGGAHAERLIVSVLKRFTGMPGRRGLRGSSLSARRPNMAPRVRSSTATRVDVHDGRRLEDDDEPEDHLKGPLAGLVAEDRLSEEGTGAPPGKGQKMKGVLRDPGSP